MKGKWLSTSKIINKDIEKPCIKLRYCPYGRLVEEYPFTGGRIACALGNNDGLMQFGHDCPVHYLMEKLLVKGG